MQIKVNIQVPLLDMQNLVEEKEEEYILEVHVKDHHEKVQVLLLLRRYTHTHTCLAMPHALKTNVTFNKKMLVISENVTENMVLRRCK